MVGVSQAGIDRSRVGKGEWARGCFQVVATLPSEAAACLRSLLGLPRVRGRWRVCRRRCRSPARRLDDRVIVGEVAAVLDDPVPLAVQRLDGVGPRSGRGSARGRRSVQLHRHRSCEPRVQRTGAFTSHDLCATRTAHCVVSHEVHLVPFRRPGPLAQREATQGSSRAGAAQEPA